MTEANKYPIDTILQISEIPDEAIPRFIAELPQIIREVRRAREVHQKMNSAFADEFELSLGELVWIDDDKNTVISSVSVEYNGEEIASVTMKREKTDE